MNKILLLMGPLLPSIMEVLENTYTLHRYWEADDPAILLDHIATECVGVVTDGGTGVSSDVLKKLPNVKLVAVFGVGVDAVDRDYCRQHNIPVTNTPDVLSDDVADMAVALALGVSRQVIAGDRYARAGRWPTQGAMPLTRRMAGKHAGIFGMGSIGNCLAKRLHGFDMQISYCNRSERENSPCRYVASLQVLAAEVDYLFITAAATPKTLGAVNQFVLDALGSEGFLINVSRGGLVDEPTLVDYLVNKRIAGAGLDVFAAEPHIPEALFLLDNVVLQPHNASGTHETRQAMGQLVIDNLAAHFAGKPLLTPI